MRDHQAVLSTAGSPQQTFGKKDLYPTVFEKAGAYARFIILNHPFLDGNKRTGMSAASIFLEYNGYRLIAKEGGIENFAIAIVTGKPEIKAITSWFKKHSKKME